MKTVNNRYSWLRNVAVGFSLRRYTERFVPIIISLLLILFSFPLSSFAAEGTFTPTGNMNSARRGHTATLLQNGKVLITGGLNTSSNTVNTAEIYDPPTGTFTPTGNMNSVRNSHTATLLPNGKVLIAGGSTYSPTLGTAEIYDPTVGIFTPIGNMSDKRVFHTATLLPNGKVLIVGGYNDSIYTTTAELYDPATGIFTSAGHMNSIRTDHTTTLIPSGKVLITGGNTAGYGAGTLNTAEIYDPATGTFTLTGNLAYARTSHTATLLSNGKVLVAGGAEGMYASINHNSAELYTPTANSKIAFASTRDGNYEIYVMNPDGTNQTRLTNNNAEDAQPSWSPDGTKIAFDSYRDGNLEIYVMNTDGTGQTRLTNNPAIDGEPSWSPDGTKIAFASWRSGGSNIFVMNSDGSNPVQLTYGRWASCTA